jgi:uncharacterized membrane protein
MAILVAGFLADFSLWATFVAFIVPALPADFRSTIGKIANLSSIANCFPPAGSPGVPCLPAGGAAE